MARKSSPADDAIARLRRCALARPGAAEGVACAGTALEKRTFRVGTKAFLFLGAKGEGFDLMLKLAASGGQAEALAAKDGERYRVGANGWVSARFLDGSPAPFAVLERWIAESRVVAGDPGAKPAARAKPTAKPRGR